MTKKVLKHRYRLAFMLILTVTVASIIVLQIVLEGFTGYDRERKDDSFLPNGVKYVQYSVEGDGPIR